VKAENGIVIYGTEPGHIKNVTFDGFHFLMANGPLNATYGGNLDLRPVNTPTGENLNLPAGLSLANSLFKHDVAGIYAHGAEALKIVDFELVWGDGLPDFFNHGIWLENIDGATITDFKGERAPNSVNGKRIEIVSSKGVKCECR